MLGATTPVSHAEPTPLSHGTTPRLQPLRPATIGPCRREALAARDPRLPVQPPGPEQGEVDAAATIYTLACPAEVKEANEVRWTRAMGQPLWEYRSANWSRLTWRYLCAVCFLAGGGYSLWYLVTRSLYAVRYLLVGE